MTRVLLLALLILALAVLVASRRSPRVYPAHYLEEEEALPPFDPRLWEHRMAVRH